MQRLGALSAIGVLAAITFLIQVPSERDAETVRRLRSSRMRLRSDRRPSSGPTVRADVYRRPHRKNRTIPSAPSPYEVDEAPQQLVESLPEPRPPVEVPILPGPLRRSDYSESPDRVARPRWLYSAAAATRVVALVCLIGLIGGFWLHLFKQDAVALEYVAGDVPVVAGPRCTKEGEGLRLCGDAEWTWLLGDKPTSTTFTTSVADIQGIEGSLRVAPHCKEWFWKDAPKVDYSIVADGIEISRGSVTGYREVTLSGTRTPRPAITRLTVTLVTVEADCELTVTIAKLLQRDAWGYWQ